MTFSIINKRYVIYYPPGFQHSKIALELLDLCNAGEESKAREEIRRKRLDRSLWRIERL